MSSTRSAATSNAAVGGDRVLGDDRVAVVVGVVEPGAALPSAAKASPSRPRSPSALVRSVTSATTTSRSASPPGRRLHDATRPARRRTSAGSPGRTASPTGASSVGHQLERDDRIADHRFRVAAPAERWSPRTPAAVPARRRPGGAPADVDGCEAGGVGARRRRAALDGAVGRGRARRTSATRVGCRCVRRRRCSAATDDAISDEAAQTHRLRFIAGTRIRPSCTTLTTSSPVGGEDRPAREAACRRARDGAAARTAATRRPGTDGGTTSRGRGWPSSGCR